MPDHIHAIVVIESRRATARVAPTVGQVIGAYKSLVDHRWRSSHECGKLWQRGFYEHVIRNDADLSETRRYIEGNPFRWLEKYR